MINAKTARKNAKEIEDNRIRALSAKLDEWIEAVVGTAITAASAEGRYSTWVQEFKEHHAVQEKREYICRKLTALGYRVSALPSGTLAVYWD